MNDRWDRIFDSAYVQLCVSFVMDRMKMNVPVETTVDFGSIKELASLIADHAINCPDEGEN